MSEIGKVEVVFLLLLFFVVVFGLLARRLGMPYPIVMVIGGLLLGFVPGMPNITLNPDLVFLVLLPPLLYAASWTISWRDFRYNLVSISLLAFGLVGFTVAAVALIAPRVFAEFDWRLGFVLGAVVAPTDAIAAASIARRVGLPGRIVDILEGESIVNDATGLVALQHPARPAALRMHLPSLPGREQPPPMPTRVSSGGLCYYPVYPGGDMHGHNLWLATVFAAATLGAQNTGYYQPVTPSRTPPPPCGHVGTRPCPVQQSGKVAIPPNATPDQVYQLALQAQRRGDISAKMQYMERAAAMGQINAETGFGVDLIYGKNVAPDLNRGLALLEKAAARNHPAALYQLGTIYDNGDFARQNPTKAAELMAGAARARYWQAEFWMGVAYEVGRGVARNRASALELLDRAAGDGQAGMPQMIAAYLRGGGANKRFANADELNAAFNADFHDQYNAHYFPSGGNFSVPGSRAWWDRITGNSTACYFHGPGCPR